MENQSERPWDYQKTREVERGGRYHEESCPENATLDKLAESGYKKGFYWVFSGHMSSFPQ
jgi:hypothetical protein